MLPAGFPESVSLSPKKTLVSLAVTEMASVDIEAPKYGAASEDETVSGTVNWSPDASAGLSCTGTVMSGSCVPGCSGESDDTAPVYVQLTVWPVLAAQFQSPPPEGDPDSSRSAGRVDVTTGAWLSGMLLESIADARVRLNDGELTGTKLLSESETVASSRGFVTARETVSVADTKPIESDDDTDAVSVIVVPALPDVVAAGTDTCGSESPIPTGVENVQFAVLVVRLDAVQSHPVPEGVPVRI